MAWWHRVGQRVVYKGSKFPRSRGYGFEKRPVKGCVYTIREIVLDEENRICFKLLEIVNNKADYKIGFAEFCFWASSFVPIKDTSIESLRALLTAPPDPALVREEADERTREVLAEVAFRNPHLRSGLLLVQRLREAARRS